MRFIKPDTKIDFIGKRKIAFSLSGAFIIISILSLIIHNGPKLGIDFAGGTLIQVQFKKPVQIDNIKSVRISFLKTPTHLLRRLKKR